MSTAEDFPLGPKQWDKPADADTLGSTYWADPLDGQTGAVLNASEIRLYCDLFGMVRPFEDDALRPASYVLHAGWWIVDGELRPVTDAEPVKIDNGTIVKVVAREVVLIPHYLIARFGLSVQQAQRGLLLGAGPQVDPGYQGTLICPVHNPTESQIVIKPEEAFGRIDFVRTGAFAPESRDHLLKLETEDALYAKDMKAAADKRLLGAGGYGIRLFNRDHRWRDPVSGYQALGS